MAQYGILSQNYIFQPKMCHVCDWLDELPWMRLTEWTTSACAVIITITSLHDWLNKLPRMRLTEWTTSEATDWMNYLGCDWLNELPRMRWAPAPPSAGSAHYWSSRTTPGRRPSEVPSLSTRVGRMTGQQPLSLGRHMSLPAVDIQTRWVKVRFSQNT